MEKLIQKSVTKFLNNDNIKKIYPSIDHIIVYDIQELNQLLIKIFLNDSDINQQNMYEKGLDPHYLTDFHLSPFLPYFGIPRTKRITFVVVSPDKEVITRFD